MDDFLFFWAHEDDNIMINNFFAELILLTLFINDLWWYFKCRMVCIYIHLCSYCSNIILYYNTSQCYKHSIFQKCIASHVLIIDLFLFFDFWLISTFDHDVFEIICKDHAIVL